MKETRAEMPRKVLLQVGLWVAPEWVVEDIEGGLQFWLTPVPPVESRTSYGHKEEEQLRGFSLNSWADSRHV